MKSCGNNTVRLLSVGNRVAGDDYRVVAPINEICDTTESTKQLRLTINKYS